MVLNTVSVTVSWSIYDSWSELLIGTRFLLDILKRQDSGNIQKNNLLRLILVSSSQMTEVMLFAQLQKYVNYQADSVMKLLEYDIKKRISFSEARQKWPQILTGKDLNFGEEPMQSMISLSIHRNAAIHHSAKCPPVDIGESAFYTAIESSKCIYDHFNKDGWANSEYKKFVDDNKPKSELLLRKAIGE